MIKPYAGSDGEESLYGLHRADIIDKHNILVPQVVAVTDVGLTVTQEDCERMLRGFIKFPPGAIKTERLWFKMPPPSNLLGTKQGDPIFSIAGNYEADEKVHFTFDIALGEPKVFKGRPILETLHQLADLVARIVSSFE